MKKPEEYLSKFWLNKESTENLSKVIEKAQNEARSQAIEDIADFWYDGIDKESILKLKK